MNLIIKFFSEDLENYIKVNQAKNKFSLAHFNFSEPFQQFSENNPNYLKIIQIRDLRDVLVSLVFYQSNEIENETGFTNFDEKLMYVITRDKESVSSVINIYKHAENATQWIKDPDVIVCRFEDLVGPQGGGSLEKKQELLVKLANSLNILLDENIVNNVMSNLFGKQGDSYLNLTFREGRIGNWKKYFKKEHIEAFENEGWADLQLRLGYPLDW